MDHLKNLDPVTRACALVGRFLQLWSLMEAELNNVVEKALDLGHLQAAIVNDNLQLRDKLHVARTALDLEAIHPKEERDRLRRRLEKIGKYSTHRNMMAHRAFWPSKKTDGVTFILVSAKGKLEFPDGDWPLSKFRTHYDKIGKFTQDLQEIYDHIKRARLLKDADVIYRGLGAPFGFPATPTPTAGLLGQGSPGLLNFQIPWPPGSDSGQPTPKQSPRKRPSHRKSK